MEEIRAFIGMDLHKETVSVAIAEGGRGGEVRHIGNFRNTPEDIAKLARRLRRKFSTLEFRPAHAVTACNDSSPSLV